MMKKLSKLAKEQQVGRSQKHPASDVLLYLVPSLAMGIPTAALITLIGLKAPHEKQSKLNQNVPEPTPFVMIADQNQDVVPVTGVTISRQDFLQAMQRLNISDEEKQALCEQYGIDLTELQAMDRLTKPLNRKQN